MEQSAAHNKTEPVLSEHLQVLDGWRAASIVCVLASHLLPLGPKEWRLNETAGPIGMALFFTLSGFLITQVLSRNPDVKVFLIRRLCRILPLAWLGLVVGLLMVNAPLTTWLRNLTFTANIPPIVFAEPTAHYWSLCVEVQFYASIALVVGIAGRRGLYLIPLACIAVTAYRISENALVDVVTLRRVDEILAGGTLALAYYGWLGERCRRLLVPGSQRGVLLVLLALGLAVSSHPGSGAMNYLRPYFAACLVGVSLHGCPAALRRLLESSTGAYLARISFALYVIHQILMHTPLGFDADRQWHYFKRVIVFVTIFALAHLSTNHFESRFIALGRRLTRSTREFPGTASHVIRP